VLYWALIFLIVAIVAAIFGFFVLAGTALLIARFLFFVFVLLFVITLLFNILGITFGPPPV
jgi:uncharacterized membrane protein YtjA (UPF0391 family)